MRSQLDRLLTRMARPVVKTPRTTLAIAIMVMLAIAGALWVLVADSRSSTRGGTALEDHSDVTVSEPVSQDRDDAGQDNAISRMPADATGGREAKAEGNMGGLRALFETVATSSLRREVTAALTVLEQEHHDSGGLRAVAADWLESDAASRQTLRNQLDVYALFADEPRAAFERYLRQDAGSEQHVELRYLLSTSDRDVEKLARLLRTDLKAVYDALDEMYGEDPPRARAIALRLLAACLDGKGIGKPVVAAWVEHEEAGRALDLLRTACDLRISQMMHRGPAAWYSQVEMEAGVWLGLALTGDAQCDPASREVLGQYASELRKRILSGSYSTSEGLVAARALGSLGQPPTETESLLVLLAKDRLTIEVRKTAIRMLAPIASPAALVALVQAETRPVETEEEAHEQTDLFRALFDSYEAHGDEQGVVLDLLRRQLREPSPSSWGRMHQAFLLNHIPASLRPHLQAELDSLANSGFRSLSNPIRQGGR